MIDFDFIPANFHQAQSMRTAVRTRAGLIGTMIVIMTLWVVANHHEISTASAMLSEIERQREQVIIHQSKRLAMEEEKARLQQHHELLNHLEGKASLVVLLSDVSYRMADAVILTQVRFESPSIAKYTVVEAPSAATSASSTPPLESPPKAPTGDGREPAYPTGNRLMLSGMATDTTVIIAFVKQLEDSPLVGEVQMRQKGAITWSGRRGQGFELTCEVFDHAWGGR